MSKLDPIEPPPRLPLKWLPKLAKKYVLVRVVAEHTHILKIIEDHRYLLAISKTVDEALAVVRRCNRQIALAIARVASFDGALHGAVMALQGDHAVGIAVLAIGGTLAYLLGRGGG
jgi:hypothetical protein